MKLLYLDVARDASDEFGGGRNPFRDVRVRRAVSLAIDRGELVRRLSGPAVPANQLVTPYIFGYDPARAPLRFDPAEARRLLADAGWPDGFEVRFPARGLFAEAARVVGEMLGRVGIRTNVVALSEPDWFQAMAERRFAITLTRFGCPTGDASDLFDNALHTPDADRSVGLSNYTGYSNREVDRLTEEAARTFEMGRRQKMLFEATARTLEELPVVPVYIDQDLYAFRSGVTWTPRNDNFLIASEIGKAP